MNHVYFSYCGYCHVREQPVQYKEEALKKKKEVVLGGREIQEKGRYVYLWLIHVDVWKKPTQ